MDFIYNMFVSLCLLLDNVIYKINTLLFSIFVELSDLKFTDSVFEDFAQRIYVIIGIFMMFKVAFSLLQMLTNPDLITDKEKGAGKLATRVVVALSLIIAVPTIFNIALQLQGTIISDNLVARLILGDVGTAEDANSSQGSAIKDQGRVMARTVFASLIETPEDEKLSEDANDSSVDEKIRKCYAMLHNNSSEINDLRDVDGVDCFVEKVDDKRIFDYKFLVSTIATGMVAWLVLGFCIDVGVRLVKLVFLQIIAPIPITTYVSGGKDNTFNKWVKMSISTYVSVFVKLIIVYFVIYVFSILNVSNLEHISAGESGISGLAMVAIILGLLVFAKNAPKLIGDLFGVEVDKESGFKGFAKTALFGATGLAAGALTGGVGSAAGNIMASRQAGNGVGRSLLSGAKGFGVGTVTGAFGGAKEKNPFKSVGAGMKIASKQGESTYNKGTTRFWERVPAEVQGKVGAQNRYQRFQSQLSLLGEYAKGRENIKTIAESDKQVRGSAFFSSAQYTTIDSQGRQVMTNYESVDQFKDAYDRAVAGGNDEEIQKAKKAFEDASKLVINTDMNDETTSIGAIKSRMDRLMRENPEAFEGVNYTDASGNIIQATPDNVTDASILGKVYGSVKTQENVIQSSVEYQRASNVNKAIGGKSNNG